MARSLRKTIESAADKVGGAEEPTSKVQEFLECMAQYDREFEKWEKRVEKILKRYRGPSSGEKGSTGARFNILWSNVQTLVPATFSKLPQPDVSRRFKDQDPVGRVSSMLLERSLEFEITHYTDYRATLRQCVMDRFLGGRGTGWIRYEPHFKGVEEGSSKPAQDDGVQITEDTDESPVEEQIDYECAPIDYVHWRDFGHEVARTWEEVTKVWRRVYMGEDAVKERFGEEIAKELPYDATPEGMNRADKTAQSERKKQAVVIELWDKTEGKAYWFSKSMKKILDEKDDPLKLQDFFPCPRPLYSTLTNETLVPVPDFTLYQDQAKTLDLLQDRASGLAEMLQVKGTYDASIPELARLFTEGVNGQLIAGKDWARFAEKNGMKGSLALVDLTPIAAALQTCQEAFKTETERVYEITGISDIIRGQTAPSETATAQQIKGQYASLRLRSMQDEVARFATECLQLKAQVICSKYTPQTIAAISAADQLNETDKPLVFTAAPAQVQPGMVPNVQLPPQEPQPTGPAMALLIGKDRLADPEADSPNPMRSFRIEVAADTLVQLDEEAEKKSRMEFVQSVGQYLEKALPVVQASPAAGPLVLELLGFGVRGFKVGKGLEGQIDAAIDGLKKSAQNPQPRPPDPAVVKAQMDKESEQARLQAEGQREQARLAHDQQVQQAADSHQQAQAAAEARLREQESNLTHQRELAKIAAQERADQRQDSFNRWKVDADNARAITVAEISAKSAMDTALLSAEQAANEEVNKDLGGSGGKERRGATKPIDALSKMHKESLDTHGKTLEAIAGLAKAVTAPKRLIRTPDGRAAGVETIP